METFGRGKTVRKRVDMPKMKVSPIQGTSTSTFDFTISDLLFLELEIKAQLS
jgi:hypothetical protein